MSSQTRTGRVYATLTKLNDEEFGTPKVGYICVYETKRYIIKLILDSNDSDVYICLVEKIEDEL